MADDVRVIMEGMVPELQDYESRGYFSRSEITSIVQHRQKFEYNLRRRNPQKQDYLSYYEYERKLEQLRLIRRKSKGITGKSTIADTGINRRIHFIFERATRRFKGDIGMWMTWLEFCKASGSKKQISKVIAKALKLHPTAPHLWAFSAAWEYEVNGNPGTARSLLQSGLRNCPRSGSLWIECFRMELLYANKILARRKALGLSDPGLSKAAEDNSILQGKLASVIHNAAIERLPDDTDMRLGMMKAVAEVPVENSSSLMELIVDSYVKAHGNDSDACIKLAGLIESGVVKLLGIGLQSACRFLADRVNEPGNGSLIESVTEWIATRIKSCDEKDQLQPMHNLNSGYQVSSSIWMSDDPEASGVTDQSMQAVLSTFRSSSHDKSSKTVKSLLKCFESKSQVECNSRVCSLWTQALVRSGRVSEAYDFLHRALKTHHTSSDLWSLALSVSIAANVSDEAARSIENLWFGCSGPADLVSTALQKTRGSMSSSLLKQAIMLLSGMHLSLDTVSEFVTSALETSSNSINPADVAWLLQTVWLCEGCDSGQMLADKLSTLPLPGIEFWHMYVKLLQAEASTRGDPVNSDLHLLIRQVFQRAAIAHGHTDVQLWLKWVKYLESVDEDSSTIVGRALGELESKFADQFALELRM